MSILYKPVFDHCNMFLSSSPMSDKEESTEELEATVVCCIVNVGCSTD